MSIAWTPDSKRLATTCTVDNAIQIWDAAAGGPYLKTLRLTDYITEVAWSPDGLMLASGSQDHTVTLWGLSPSGHWRCQKVLRGAASINSVAWCPVDGAPCVASGNSDNTVCIWHSDTGACMKTLQGHSDWVTSVAWSPNCQRLVSGSHDTTLRLWDAAVGGPCLMTLQGHTDHVKSVAWSPDGMLLASAGVDAVLVWDVKTGKCLKTLGGEAPENCVTWSPDGKRLASGSDDATVYLWDMAADGAMAKETWHEGEVTSVAWSPDGKLLASGGSDRTLRLWNV
jgi:WD40 repeat protein